MTEKKIPKIRVNLENRTLNGDNQEIQLTGSLCGIDISINRYNDSVRDLELIYNNTTQRDVDLKKIRLLFNKYNWNIEPFSCKIFLRGEYNIIIQA